MALDLPRLLPHLAYLVPSLAVAACVLRALPIHSNQLPSAADPGLASLSPDSRAREVYPEDWTAGGAYVTLPEGRVRYWVSGPESGKKITLIHGLTIPAICFTPLIPILVAAGFRVLVFDLYGRGYSDAPRSGVYDTKRYVTQLALLLQHLRWERTRVVGFSMGGGIAAGFVATFPHLVERDVVLIASTGGLDKPFPYTGYRHLSYIQGRVMRNVLSRVPQKNQTPLNEIVTLQAAHLPGYKRAVTSSIHDGSITCMRWAFESEHWSEKRVLLIHGTRDPTVPHAHSSLLAERLRSLGGRFRVQPGEAYERHPVDTTLVSVEGAGHDVTYTNAAEVGKAMVAFLDFSDAREL